MEAQSGNRAVKEEGAAREEVPVPPRFWWFKRGVIGFGLLLVLLAALRFWWGHEARRRIELIAQAAHAQGEPVYIEDFTPSIPDAENAAVPIEAAVKLLSANPEFTISDITTDLPGPQFRGEIPDMEAKIRQVRPELNLVRSARNRSRAAIATPFFPDYSYQRMGEILDAAADYKHFIGDDAAAIEYLHDAITLADILDQASASYVPHFVAKGIDVDALDRLGKITRGLSISEHSDQGVPPTQAQVRSLIAALLDERAMRTGAERGAEGDGARALYLGSGRAQLRYSVAAEVLEPMYRLDGARVYAFQSANAQAIDQLTLPAATAKLKIPSPGKPSPLETMARPFENDFDSPMGVLYDYFPCLAERRIVAVMLAIRLYAADHQGTLPSALSELVSGYLPTVPRDPFDPANGPIRYLPKHDPPVLYSVGFNGIDDEGSQKDGPLPYPADARWHSEDLVYPVETPRVSPAQNHQGNK